MFYISLIFSHEPNDRTNEIKALVLAIRPEENMNVLIRVVEIFQFGPK